MICDFGAVFVLTNTAVKATDDLQYIYPTRETISRGDVSIMQSWPVWNGVDRSWYKNVAPRMAIFGHDVHRNFFGVDYHHSDYGVVHVATYRQDPGKKIWSWGTARSGKIWDRSSSTTTAPFTTADGPPSYIQLGEIAIQQRDYKESATLLKRALEYNHQDAWHGHAVSREPGTGAPSNPDLAQQYYWLGVALQAQHLGKEAEVSWKKAASETGDCPVYAALADKKLGETQLSAEALEQCKKTADQLDSTQRSTCAQESLNKLQDIRESPGAISRRRSPLILFSGRRAWPSRPSIGPSRTAKLKRGILGMQSMQMEMNRRESTGAQ